VSVSTSSGKRAGPSGSSDPAPRPTRRVFSPEYKLAIVAEYENAANGGKGAILRREGLYSSHIIEWARARDAGVLTGGRPEPGASTKRPRKNAEALELEKLRRQNEKLRSDLSRTRMALDIMGKAHELLEELSESDPGDPRAPKS
jgi:transposase